MSAIVLTTLNARYAHSALALRYLYANLKELQTESRIMEFVIDANPQSVAEELLTCKPRIIGLSVYIWNALQIAELIHILKKVSPQTLIILGGPEAAYRPHRVDLSGADCVVSGEGEAVFYTLCRDVLAGRSIPKHISAPVCDLASIALPYEAYSNDDIAHRYIYVEASRGCPFLCEFCLSSIDEKLRRFDLPRLLEALERLWMRGARDFKFIDRTFNINIRFAAAILDFFLAKEPPYFLHFEVIPDHFPDAIKERLEHFEQGSLQLEIGIQTLDAEVAARINRPLNVAKIEENLRFLRERTCAHLHLDLIVGLPGESIEGFAANLDRLHRMGGGSEIQIGILKKLSGTTMARHDEVFDMRYSDLPPYDLLCNDRIDFARMQEMKRFARFWDLLYNSGNFTSTLPLLWEGEKVFDPFDRLCRWIYTQTRSTHKIALERLAELLGLYLIDVTGAERSRVVEALDRDLGGIKGRARTRLLEERSLTPQKNVPHGKHKRQEKHR
ncbi:MAG: DUF4080 domain-containing protein [Campylobacterales bacterium]|nr:DUF4080 domain-containing protein [Campylobacterales bacterium]